MLWESRWREQSTPKDPLRHWQTPPTHRPLPLQPLKQEGEGPPPLQSLPLDTALQLEGGQRKVKFSETSRMMKPSTTHLHLNSDPTFSHPPCPVHRAGHSSGLAH